MERHIEALAQHSATLDNTCKHTKLQQIQKVSSAQRKGTVWSGHGGCACFANIGDSLFLHYFLISMLGVFFFHGIIGLDRNIWVKCQACPSHSFFFTFHFPQRHMYRLSSAHFSLVVSWMFAMHTRSNWFNMLSLVVVCLPVFSSLLHLSIETDFGKMYFSQWRRSNNQLKNLNKLTHTCDLTWTDTDDAA